MLSPDQELDLHITVADLQVIMTGLGELPYRVSAAVIDKVRQQVLAVDSEAFGPRPAVGNGVLQPGPGGAL